MWEYVKETTGAISPVCSAAVPCSTSRLAPPGHHGFGQLGQPGVVRVPAERLVGSEVNRRAARRRPSARSRWYRSAISRRFSCPVSRPSTAENWPVTPMGSGLSKVTA